MLPSLLTTGKPYKRSSSIRPSGKSNFLHLTPPLVLVFIWLLIFIWFERLDPYFTVKKCQWKNWEYTNINATDNNNNVHVSLIADPQLVDNHTYPGRNPSLLYLSEKIVDNYIFKSNYYINKVLKPNTTFFLGDLLDNGRESTNKYYKPQVERFNKIFPIDQINQYNGKRYLNIPGNHDIGFGDYIIPSSLIRFKETFGYPDSNKSIEIANHKFVLLDTISLSDNVHPESSIEPRKLMEFMNNDLDDIKPRIMLSHVTLFKQNPDKCGPLRESKNPKFPIQRGIQYQTVIEQNLSNEILEKIRPIAMFAGDDHDYCFTKEKYIYNNKEFISDSYNVKSISMAMGIKYPSIQLLSLRSDLSLNEDGKTFDTINCFMTVPYLPLIVYITFAILNIVILTLFNFQQTAQYKMLRLSQKLWSTLNIKSNKKKPYLRLNTIIPLTTSSSGTTSRERSDSIGLSRRSPSPTSASLDDFYIPSYNYEESEESKMLNFDNNRSNNLLKNKIKIGFKRFFIHVFLMFFIVLVLFLFISLRP